jgi:hypothetical protein
LHGSPRRRSDGRERHGYVYVNGKTGDFHPQLGVRFSVWAAQRDRTQQFSLAQKVNPL